MEREKAIKLVQDALLDYGDFTSDQYTLETTFSELHIDSLSIVEISIAIEDRIKESIKDVELKSIKTVGDLVTLLEQRYQCSTVN